MARVLITGANGFTGRHLADRLARDGHAVFGLLHHNGESGPETLNGTAIADLRDLPALERAVAEVRPDRVVHLAAIANVAHGNAADLYAINILGTRNLLQALASAEARPSSVLIASSANVYGNRRSGALTEDMPPAPANDYGITKVACELVAQVYSDRLPIITARPFNYTGRGQSEHFLIPKIVAHFKAKAPVIELGNLNVARDFSDVRAVVDAYARLLEAPAAIGQTVNICSGQAHTLQQLLELIGQLAHHRIETRVNPAFVRSDEVEILCGSRAKLESLIGPVDMPPLSDTIAWMLDA